MNTDDYSRYEDTTIDRLPADALVLDFVLADFKERAKSYTDYRVVHLRGCPDRTVTAPTIASKSTCGEGTCEIDPEVTAIVDCPHRNRLIWSVDAETMGQLLDRIAKWSDERDARVDAFIGRTVKV